MKKRFIVLSGEKEKRDRYISFMLDKFESNISYNYADLLNTDLEKIDFDYQIDLIVINNIEDISKVLRIENTAFFDSNKNIYYPKIIFSLNDKLDRKIRISKHLIINL